MGRKLCGCCGEIKDSKEFYKSPKIKEEYIFLCKNCCGQKLKEGNYNYWGVTKLGISLVYFLK